MNLDEWMDDLSEDWVPQSQSPSDAASTSQSQDSQRKRVLSERSQNTSNIQANSVQRPRKGLSRRSLSDASSTSRNGYDTTARKSVSVSPPKARNADSEPEWRRRLLQGQIGHGEQKDLFSPMPIENMFHKPGSRGSLRPTNMGKPRGLSFLQKQEQTLSTGPSRPAIGTPFSQAPAGKFATMRNGNLDSLEEEDENSNVDDLVGGRNGSLRVASRAGSSVRQASQSSCNGSVKYRRSLPSRQFSMSSVRFHPSSRKPSETSSFSMSQGSDDFSPVYISKHNTSDGRIAYAPLDLSKSELQERIHKLHASEPSQQSASTNGIDESSFAGLESENLPEDLAHGTPEVADGPSLASLGQFVSVKRGGYSEVGSFKQRPLSPSPLAKSRSRPQQDSSMMQPDSVMDDSVMPTAPTPPQAERPKTPVTMGASGKPSSNHVKPPNSPLKLFSQHDTFTVDRLQRRISQLEDPGADLSKELGGSPSRRNTGNDFPPLQDDKVAERRDDPACRRQASRFGRGELDGHEFPEDGFSSPRSSEAHDDSPSRSSSPDVNPPGAQQPFRCHVQSPPLDFHDTFKGKVSASKGYGSGGLSITKRSDRTRPRLSLTTETCVVSQPSQISRASEGKRPLTPSPFKSPTPKRRRTLFNEEYAKQTLASQVSSYRESSEKSQSTLGRKRKDARYDAERNMADPDIIAQRAILRPRNPTPSQRRRQEAEAAVAQAEMEARNSPRLDSISGHLTVPPMPGETLDHVQARLVANSMVVFTEDVAQRKKSVTTQDYLDHAMRVMDFIRNSGRPNSNLASVMEQDSVLAMEEGRDPEGDVLQQSVGLSLERPPSREGKPSGWRSRAAQIDARVASHLRRYQEAEGRLHADSIESEYSHSWDQDAIPIEAIESDPPGLQIIGQIPGLRQRDSTRGDRNMSGKDQHSVESAETRGTNGTRATHSSKTSMDSTLGRTTGSRKSDTVAHLAPETVAHLIPESIAGMTFDKALGKWVKVTKSGDEGKKINSEHSTVAGSDNDPFGDIPDLTVDSMEETKHLLLSKSTSRKDIGFDPEATSVAWTDADPQPAARERGPQSLAAVDLLKHTYPPQDFVSEARPVAPAPTVPLRDPRTDEDIEHEISIYEGRDSPKRSLRNVQVSLSSPIWTRPSKVLSPLIESPVSTRDFASKARPPMTPAFLHPQNRQLSLSVRVKGTLAKSQNKLDLTEHPETPCKGDLTFYLSDLPDFTLDQVDERDLQGRLLSKHNTVGPAFSGVEDRYANGNFVLVKALQEVAPKEPYWEDLRKVDLQRRDLTSLHILDVLCERLERLDVAHNQLSQLNGAPYTLRALNASYNLLTSLTSWGHLRNLQYLDVTHNNIGSLEGFAGLVHLRELRADGNQIQSLKGVDHLDGLLILRLRDNELKEVDFHGTELRRLETLDLGKNSGLEVVRGLHLLPAVKQLNLDSCALASFPQESQAMTQLVSLDISWNRLQEADLAEFSPRLELLNLDGNCLRSTADVSNLRHLHCLSLRSQSPDAGRCDLAPILEAHLHELRALYLSENRIPTLAIPHDWYSLRILEIASCGLQDLPNDFGLSVPSLRELNLNFNAIKDLRPLLNIKALAVLHAAGNRLERLRKTAAVLGKLRQLEVADLRDNPLTIGFYAKVTENRLVRTASDMPSPDLVSVPRSQVVCEDVKMRNLLPSLDGDVDAQYAARLDEGTKLRRRVYEMLMAGSCSQIKQLDGKPLLGHEVMVKDAVWHKLVELGVVRKSGKALDDQQSP